MFQGFFNYDNDVWRFVGRLADMMVLNLLWILFSLPIVTLGASTTALYYCTIKIVHEEDRGNFRMFMHSFKQNLKEGIILWMILLPILVILLLDHRFFSMIFADNTALRFLSGGLRMRCFYCGYLFFSISGPCFPALIIPGKEP